MRDCPRCDKHTLDVTGKKNEFRCWSCGFECIIKPFTTKELSKLKEVGGR